MTKVLKEKYPYHQHPGGISTNDWRTSTYAYPIYWRYKNSVEQDFKHAECSPWNDGKKLKVGVTTKGRYWVGVRHTVQAPYGGNATGGYDWIVYCDEIEWLYPEDMKELAA